MAQPYIGEIRMFGGNFAPVGWEFCSGQLVPISEYETLFNLIGTTYGGDGESTFALPDLRGRVPMHMGGGATLGQSGGVESVTLTVQQIPVHSHAEVASTSPGSANSPVGNVLGEGPSVNMLIEDVASSSMNAAAISSAGGSQPHENFQPYLCVSFIISMFGIFPSQT